jgi:hypothetical protein
MALVYSSSNRKNPRRYFWLQPSKIKIKKGISGGKAWPKLKDDSITATCGLIVWTKWDPRHLTKL